MTAVTMTAAMPDLRSMTEEDMLAAYAGADDALRAALLAECRRRDRADRARRARQAEMTAWREAVEAEYLAADAECAGNLLSKRGRAEGIQRETVLWGGSERWARARASEELNAYWDRCGRLTLTAYRRQFADAARVARDDADLAAWDAEVTEPAAAAEWEALADGGRVRETAVTVSGERRPAWWAMTPAGTASLHRDRDAAVTAASPVRSAERPAEPQRQPGRVIIAAEPVAAAYAAAVAVRKGSRVTVTDLGEHRTLAAAQRACQRFAGRRTRLDWQARNLTTWGAQARRAGFCITASEN